MTPTERNYIFYLEDMLLSMTRIKEYIEDFDFRSFKVNYMVVDAPDQTSGKNEQLITLIKGLMIE